MKGNAKKAVKYAEDHGYALQRINSKQLRVYRNANGHEISINTGCTDAGLKLVCQQIDRARGVGPDLTQKRNPEQIKARREAERAALAEERARDLRRLDALADEKRRALLAGHGAELTRSEVRRITEQMEATERRLRELDRLMRQCQDVSA